MGFIPENEVALVRALEDIATSLKLINETLQNMRRKK
jgi:hypothetical protein